VLVKQFALLEHQNKNKKIRKQRIFSVFFFTVALVFYIRYTNKDGGR